MLFNKSQNFITRLSNPFILFTNICTNECKAKHLYWCKSLLCLLMCSTLCGPVAKLRQKRRGRNPPVQAHKTALWKATSISTQTSAVTQIRQPQCSGALSPAAGGGQPDLRRMETFSPRNRQNQLLPSSINAAPRLLLSSFLCNCNSLRPVLVTLSSHATRLTTDDNWTCAWNVVQVKVSTTHLGEHSLASTD